jgi:hypothetical protein
MSAFQPIFCQRVRWRGGVPVRNLFPESAFTLISRSEKIRLPGEWVPNFQTGLQQYMGDTGEASGNILKSVNVKRNHNYAHDIG